MSQVSLSIIALSVGLVSDWHPDITKTTIDINIDTFIYLTFLLYFNLNKLKYLNDYIFYWSTLMKHIRHFVDTNLIDQEIKRLEQLRDELKKKNAIYRTRIYRLKKLMSAKEDLFNE